MSRSSSGSRTAKLVLATAGAVSVSALVLAGCSSNASDAAGEVTPEGQASASQSASGSASATASAAAKAKAKESASASAQASQSASATASSSASASSSATSSSSSKAKKPSSSYNMSGGKTTAKPSTKPSKNQPSVVAPRITVSKTRGLKSGDYVTVSGSGFDTSKGIYVAFCVITGGKPTPCGGGADTDGDSGYSEWISDNPPRYGQGLVKPYGPNGSFTVRIKVSKSIGSFDCSNGKCGVTTRADHTRSSDRSADEAVRIYFA